MQAKRATLRIKLSPDRAADPSESKRVWCRWSSRWSVPAYLAVKSGQHVLGDVARLSHYEQRKFRANASWQGAAVALALVSRSRLTCSQIVHDDCKMVRIALAPSGSCRPGLAGCRDDRGRGATGSRGRAARHGDVQFFEDELGDGLEHVLRGSEQRAGVVGIPPEAPELLVKGVTAASRDVDTADRRDRPIVSQRPAGASEGATEHLELGPFEVRVVWVEVHRDAAGVGVRQVAWRDPVCGLPR